MPATKVKGTGQPWKDEKGLSRQIVAAIVRETGNTREEVEGVWWGFWFPPAEAA